MSKATPGPWGFVAESGQPVVVYAEAEANDTDDVAVIACRKTDAITLANARLIAAAPDLLAALERLVSELTGKGTGLGLQEATTAAQTAIKQAKGA